MAGGVAARRRRRRPRGARAAPVGLPPRAAAGLQRRRERALRRRRDRDVRAHLQPELLHQPARLHVPAARRVRARLRRPRRRRRGLRRRPRRRVRASRARCRPCSARSPSGCWRGRGRGCSTAASASWPRRCSRSPSCPCTTPTSRSTTSRRSRRVCLALVGIARRLRARALGDYALAGAGLGLACATKYTGGIVLLPLLAAALVGAGQSDARRVGGLALAGVLALAFFLTANPFALLDFDSFRDGLSEQSAASSDGGGKLGLTADSGILYYLGTTTWGLGWLPAAGRARRRGGARRARLAPRARARARDRRLRRSSWARRTASSPAGCCRVYPLLCLLAAYGAVVLATWAFERVGRPRPAWAAAVGGRAAVRAGARVRDPQRRRARPPRHAPAGPRLDGRERPGGHARS